MQNTIVVIGVLHLVELSGIYPFYQLFVTRNNNGEYT